MMFNPFSALTSKIFGGLSLGLLLALGGLYLHDRHVTKQRDDLRQWQDDVVTATRDAAHRPKLALDQAALQIRYLGEENDSFIAAQKIAVAQAQAAKAEQERKDEERKHHAQDVMDQRLADQRSRSADWIAAHRVRDGSAGPPANAGGSGSPDLPSPAFGAKKPNGPDRGSGLVAVPDAYIAACDAVTARLHNIRDDWWKSINPSDFPAEEPTHGNSDR